MYKVLVYGMGSVYGGIENVVMNYYRNIDSSKVHFDFICSVTEENKEIAYSSEIKQNGSNVYYLHSKFKKPLKHRKELINLFKAHATEYDCIWLNMSDLTDISILKTAKKYGIKKIIVHSHNSRLMSVGIKKVIKLPMHYLNKLVIDKYATDFWACSKVAQEWLFPQKIYDRVEIIKNAISINDKKFDIKKQNKLRKKYNLHNQYIIGHVGRLDFQKNQQLIIKIYNKVIKAIPDSKLIFVGAGKDYDNLKKQVNELGLENNVMFVGVQKDIQAWYSLFDLFLFPSLFEGLSLALLEAQANGIPVLTSNMVSPEEVKINNNLLVENLNSNLDTWVQDVINMHDNYKRLDIDDIAYSFKKHGYEITEAAKRLQNLFLN